jgi:Protein of unknown function DUF2625
MNMKRLTLLLAWLMIGLFGRSQIKSLKELTDTSDTGWEVVRILLPKATNKVEILPRDSARANQAVYQSQLAVQTTMGAIEYMTGGIMIDGGWIRIIGSGSPRLPRSLPEWNEGKSIVGYGHTTGFYLVADDVLGGFFALNWGGLAFKDAGKVFYLGPDDLQWKSTGGGYGEFLQFCFTGNLEKFYTGLRWKNWHQEVDTLSGDRAFYIMPPLWSVEGKDIEKDERHAVPIGEIYFKTLALQHQSFK